MGLTVNAVVPRVNGGGRRNKYAMPRDATGLRLL